VVSSQSGLPLAAEGLVEVGWARVVPSELLLPGLAADDRARCGRLRRSGDRDRSATARVLLRAAVGAWMGMVADTVVIRSACASCGGTDHGRPYVAAVPGTLPRPHVSVAHAGDVAVVALTEAGPLGVDVEPTDAAHFDRFDEVALADTEAARVTGPARGPGARTRTWVRKEAVLKASGFGLATDPRKIVISAAHEAPRVIRPPHDDDATCWQLRDVELTTGYACSVAVRTHAVGSIDVQVDEVDVHGLISGGSSGRNSHA
jgi:4'-phosphopantetheinyl transferase